MCNCKRKGYRGIYSYHCLRWEGYIALMEGGYSILDRGGGHPE